MTSAAAFGLSQIGQIAVNVHDTGRAVAFYRDQLGIRFLFSAGQLAFFDAGGIRLMLTPPEKPEFDHLSSIVYFKVSDIKQAHATLTERGVKFEDAPHMIARMPDHELWMTHFRDSENNLLSLMSEVRP
jgi:predicted enzyme related to lactoylglutathione lyase